MSLLSYAAAIGLARAGVMHPPSRSTIRRAALGMVLAAGAMVGARAGYDYWTDGRFLLSTDNAYVRADYTTVAPRISGYVTEVLVHDNQVVAAGQVLARIDDRGFKVALDQAEADVAAAHAALRNLDARIAQQQSAIDQEKADIAAGKASLAFAEADSVRYENLKKSGYGSVRRAEQAESELRERMALLRKTRARLLGAERSVDVLASEREQVEAQHQRSLARRRQAELNMSFASIVAPVDGTIGARSLRVGQYVQAGTPLMAVVPLQVYVVANYKETQVAQVRAGQWVAIEVDSFPGVTLTGRVDSLSPASGREFSLLPADNATGNFTKIVQRVPVRITLEEGPLAGKLRPGMSVSSTIDARQRP